MPIKIANNASGTLATAISASDTGIVLTTGNGAEFPTLAAGEYFYATLSSSGGTQELVRVNARSGDSLTVVRAQGGTSAAGFAAGSRFELRVTTQSIVDTVYDISRYQGASATNPTTRLNGEPLLVGDFYFNTGDNSLRFYNGASWQSVVSGSISIQQFSGNGVTTAFSFSTAPSVEAVTQVYINGVYQQKDTYTLVGTTLTFSQAPVAGTGNIEVVVIEAVAIGTLAAPSVTYSPAVTSLLTAVDVKNALDDLSHSSTGSTKVGFIQAGTGAVARTAQSKLRDVVSVKDFGAVGDGVADDTAAIQAALTASVGGGEIYFPKGTYKFSSTLTLTDSVKLRGVSMFGSDLKYTGSGVAILIPSASGRNVITDMTISGTSKTGTGVQIGDTNFSGQHVLERVRIRQFSTGLRLAGALWTSVLQCFISGNATGVDFNAGWGAGYSTTVLFVECRISENDYEGVNASYVPVRNQSITFIGGAIEYNCSADLTRYQHVTGNVQQLSLINVYYESSGVTKPNGLNLQQAGPFTIQDCFFNSLNYGIYATVASRGRIDGCRFITIDAKDIFLSGGVNVNNIEIGTSNEFSAAGNTLAGANVIAYVSNKSKAQQIETNTTFTPTIRGASTAGTPTYTLQSGSYSKVGNLVCFKVRVSISNKGGMVGMISIEGLPIAASQLLGTSDIFSMEISGATATASNTYFYAQISNNTTSILLYQGGSTSNAQIVDTQLANSTTVLVSGCYQAAS